MMRRDTPRTEPATGTPHSRSTACEEAAKAYAAAREAYAAALRESTVVYERLLDHPDSIEYKIDWDVARRHEAAAAATMRSALERYRLSGEGAVP